MTKRKVLVTVAISIGLFLPIVSMADGLKIGTNAPFFKVKSGDGKELTLKIFWGQIFIIDK
ncbi:MAG: hypothetical protein J7L53_03375 [Deltaproteobacteria bacterium]|nr:hypothetical protein [Deltaproteobacteria bacterium]